MLKLIGLIVVVAIAVVGYPAFQSWYAGDAAPDETVNAVRNRLGEAMRTDTPQNAQQPAAQVAPQVSAEAEKKATPAEVKAEPMTANQMMKDMMKE